MLEWIVSSTALAAALIAIRYLFKGRISPLVQYAFWALLLVRLLLPFSFGGSFLSVNNLLRTPEITEGPSISPEPVVLPDDLLFAESMKQEDTDFIFMDTDTDTDTIPMDPLVINSSGGVQAGTGFSAADQKEEDSSPGLTAPQSAVKEKAISKPYTAKQILFIIWAAGSLCVLAWFLFCNIKYYVCLKKNRVPLDPEITGNMDQWNMMVSGSRRLPVYLSPALDVPCLFGLLHPAIYVTDEVSRNEVFLRHVLVHETAHYRHGDHIWSVLRGICIALHWFNPLVWWAGFLSRRDCELACDEAALKILGESEKSGYGNTLLNITCTHSPAGMLTAATISGKKSAIYERIKMMTSRNNQSVISVIAALLIVVIAAGCTFTGAAEHPMEESVKESAAAEEQAYISEENPSGNLPMPADLTEQTFALEEIPEEIEYIIPLEEIPEELLEQIYDYEDSQNKCHYDYDKKKWITEDGREYEYAYILGGRLNNSVADTCFVVLSNRDDVTFEQCERHWLSSNTEDHFDPEETVIVDMHIQDIIPAYELHVPVEKNGWTVVSADVSDILFSLTCSYPEQLFEKDPPKNNCADLTAIRFQDGTLIDNFPYAVRWTWTVDAENQQTFFTQSISLDRLQDNNPTLVQKSFSMEDIEAVYIAEWDPQEKAFDRANMIEIVLKEADIRTQFLKWRFTTNLNNRWVVYQDALNTFMAGMTATEQDEAPVGIAEPDQDIQEKLEAAVIGYYSEISEFTSAELVQQMRNNRTPMSDDSLYLEYGVQTEFADVTFGEGKEDPFASGLIYDFDARVIVNGYENLPGYPYAPDEDGYVHMTGQITVDEGLITNIYVAKQKRSQGSSAAADDSENEEIRSDPEDMPDVTVNAQPDHFRGLFEYNEIEVTYDADVVVSGNPEAIVTAVPHTFTGDEVKHLAETLFDGNEIYEVNTLKTADELRLFIEADQSVLDSLDPEVEPELYEYRQELFRNEIAAFESMLPDAEDSYEPQKPDWTFKLDGYEKAYMEAMGQDPGELNEEIRVYSQIDGRTAFVNCVSTTKESFILNWFRFWVEDGYQEEQLKETPEEAQSIVMDQLQKMGLADRWTIKSCKAMYQHDEREEEKDHSPIHNAGYYYDIDLVPQYAGCEVLPQDYMFASADLTSWPYRYEYEKLHIQFSNGRIVYMDYRNPLEITDTAELGNAVIPLEEAVACFEEQVQSGQFRDQFYIQAYGQNPSNIKVAVSTIEFGLLRIRMSEEEAVYEMTPVWNFKGSTTCIYETETVTSPLYGNEEEIMAINAIDGSVIMNENGQPSDSQYHH